MPLNISSGAGRPPTTSSVGYAQLLKALCLPKGKKPEALLKRVIDLVTANGDDDWVLDSFAGSGTTAAVAHKMRRRWITIELGNHAITLCHPRLKRVVDGEDSSGITKAVGWQGGGFKFLRLAESLLVKDKDLSTKRKQVYVINPKYDATMLVRAICKIENFRYLKNGRWHGASSEHHFLHVTTRLLTQRHLDALAADLGPDDALLLYCTRRATGLKAPDNIEVKKIPRDLLAKCSFEEDK
jgi:adenine-specific DNA-methyltransferase